MSVDHRVMGGLARDAARAEAQRANTGLQSGLVVRARVMAPFVKKGSNAITPAILLLPLDRGGIWRAVACSYSPTYANNSARPMLNDWQQLGLPRRTYLWTRGFAEVHDCEILDHYGVITPRDAELVVKACNLVDSCAKRLRSAVA